MSIRPSPPTHVARTRVDISLLQLSDRACLRLLEHTRVATASQLTDLIYPSLRTALRRTRKLYLDRLITRESLPAQRGGIPLAYRLSETGRRRLHLNAYRSPGLVTLRHALDGVEFVASLVGFDPGLVQLWLTESHIPHFADGVQPDQLVVLDTGEASALLLVEVDESTERPPVIRDRLRAYAKLFEDHRIGWHLLWVANSRERLARLRQIAGSTKDAMLSGRCWGVAVDDVANPGTDAEGKLLKAQTPLAEHLSHSRVRAVQQRQPGEENDLHQQRDRDGDGDGDGYGYGYGYGSGDGYGSGSGSGSGDGYGSGE